MVSTRSLGYEAIIPFLKEANPAASEKSLRTVAAIANDLGEFPRLGVLMEDYSPREIRRLIVMGYELRYEIKAKTIYVLRVLHHREDSSVVIH